MGPAADATVSAAELVSTTPSGVRHFERRIRPVLVERCYACHSQAAGKADGGLLLDTAEGLSKGGNHGIILVPGQPSESSVLKLLRSPHPVSANPRERPVSGAVLADFEVWIRMGAPDPRRQNSARPPNAASASNHWAFQKLRMPTVPRVQLNSWPQDPLDNFVLFTLESNGLAPAQPASKTTWLRRVTFDLTGLPPTISEIDTFLADQSPSAYSIVVDRLLKSQHFGERWAEHWLETAGYADFDSADVNGPRENAWRYRDYVVNAFNEDKPFDEFVREQLAGDLLSESEEAPRPEQKVATGFLTIGAKLRAESNLRRVEADLVDDQVELISRTFLGMTMACARCHDHKSDPITHQDYVALAGIFSSTASTATPDGRRGARQWLEVSLATPEELRSLSEFESRLTELKAKLREAREMKIAFPGDIDSTALAGIVVDNLAAELQGQWKESSYSTNFVDRNYLHDGDADKGKKSARYVPDLPAAGAYEVLISYTPRVNRATNVPVTIRSADGSKTVLLDQTLVPTTDKVFASVGTFRFQAGKGGSVTISNLGTKGFVVADAVRFVPIDEKGNRPQALQETPAEETALLNYRQLERELLEFRNQRPILPRALAVEEGNIKNDRVRSGATGKGAEQEVPRAFPAALGTPSSTLYLITDESSGRLELAHWLASPDNPLTARVTVNRIWQHLIGRGLVESEDEFGVLGTKPSHPDLLDYLATRYIASGWSTKQLVRDIVLSRTYGMDSVSAGQGSVRDPENKWLWRMNVRTMELPGLRDFMLAVTGELDLSLGGTWNGTNSITMDPVQQARRIQLSSIRRSLYLPAFRGQSPELFRQLGDAVASSKLTLTNSGAARLSQANRFVEQRAWFWSDALRHTTNHVTNQRRIELAYRQSMGRPPTSAEEGRAAQFISQQSSSAESQQTTSNSEKRGAASAWDQFCAALLLSSEFRTVR